MTVLRCRTLTTRQGLNPPAHLLILSQTSPDQSCFTWKGAALKSGSSVPSSSCQLVHTRCMWYARRISFWRSLPYTFVAITSSCVLVPHLYLTFSSKSQHRHNRPTEYCNILHKCCEVNTLLQYTNGTTSWDRGTIIIFCNLINSLKFQPGWATNTRNITKVVRPLSHVHERWDLGARLDIDQTFTHS